MNWLPMKIEDFCATGSGGTPSRNRKERYYGGNIPWVKSGELRTDIVRDTQEKITDEAIAESSAKIVEPGAILVAMYGATVGQSAILGIRAATNQAVCHIVPRPEMAISKFVHYALKTQMTFLLASRVGGAQPNISQTIIRNLRVLLPPLTEQRRIAEILDQADALRQQRRAADEKAQRILPALFYHMFGDPLQNPHRWQAMRLGDPRVADINPRADTSGMADDTEVSFVPMADVDEVWGRIVGTQTRPFADVRKGFTPFADGDVVFAKITPCMQNGKAAIASKLENGRAFGSTEFHVLRAGSVATKEWLYVLVRLGVFRKQAEASFTGTAGQQRVPASFLKNYEVPLPPLALQQAFANAVRIVLAKVSIADDLQITCVFDNLLHRAFTGDLTAKWREAHRQELEAEMEAQARELKIYDCRSPIEVAGCHGSSTSNRRPTVRHPARQKAGGKA